MRGLFLCALFTPQMLLFCHIVVVITGCALKPDEFGVTGTYSNQRDRFSFHDTRESSNYFDDSNDSAGASSGSSTYFKNETRPYWSLSLAWTWRLNDQPRFRNPTRTIFLPREGPSWGPDLIRPVEAETEPVEPVDPVEPVEKEEVAMPPDWWERFSQLDTVTQWVFAGMAFLLAVGCLVAIIMCRKQIRSWIPWGGGNST
jgi:hypothetical protein